MATHNQTFIICAAALLLLTAPQTAQADEPKDTSSQPGPTQSAEVQRAAAKLPKLPSLIVPKPSDETVLAWSPSEKGRFLNEAKARKQGAQTQVDQAQDLLKRAQLLTRSLVPSQRAYGESEAQFGERQSALKKEVNGLLKPYEQYTNDAQSALAKAEQVVNACLMSERGLDGGWTPIGR